MVGFSDYLSTLNGGARVKDPPASLAANSVSRVDGASGATVVHGYHQPLPQRLGTIVPEMKCMVHAPISHFDVSQLTPKGPRKNPDVGAPHDASRKLGQMGILRSGSWWCAEGGWPSPNQRATTEIFHVVSGHGCLTDVDGARHFFGPGDTVVLPKGWTGRWDVLEPIHKIWFVVEHAHIEEYGYPIRVLVKHYNQMASRNLKQQGIRLDAMYGTKPTPASFTYYDVGPTKVGWWTCTTGSFPVISPLSAFHVMEGVFLMHNEKDGTMQRVVAGDTVMLPKGWSGHWDIIEPVKKLWVVVKEEA